MIWIKDKWVAGVNATVAKLYTLSNSISHPCNTIASANKIKYVEIKA